MILRKHLFQRVTIVGVGLIGGSIGLAIRKFNLAQQIVGYSHHQTTLANALKNQVVDEAHPDLKRALLNSDLVILATPVNTIIQMFSQILPHLRRGAIIIDVGSTKASIVEAAFKALGQAAPMFVGCHPLAGSEKKGSDYAHADLFQGSTCILTPTEKTNYVAKEKVKHLWTKVGATVKFLAPEEHDQILSYISHLPHIAAYALIHSIPTEHLPYGSQGLKDTTRIASSSSEMWKDICLANSKNILKSLDEYVKSLSSLRRAIATRDENVLAKYFEEAKTKRDGIKS